MTYKLIQPFTIHGRKNPDTIVTIKDVTLNKILKHKKYSIISGTGGAGKSMMVRHLLLDAIKNYDELCIVPILISLKDYDSKYNLLSFIYEKFSFLGANCDESEFEKLLLSGNFLLLLDGLDEIKIEYREDFENKLESFTDKFHDNVFIISSRPDHISKFSSFPKFSVLDISAFSKEQSIELIKKLNFRTDDPDIKIKFINALEETLYITHREFVRNPLLLTIMLMTYEQFADIPKKMHIFYAEAFTTLAQRHDASKGAFKRSLKSGLNTHQFAEYFSEFCAKTYINEQYELTEHEFCEVFKKFKRNDICNIDPSDFLYDLNTNMCLMYEESRRYHFTHRSFQEYFCALHFSKLKDKELETVGKFFEDSRNSINRHYGDKTFNMLYDMIQLKVEEYIFFPYLDTLLKKCNSENGYKTFLTTIYPNIYYESGDTNEFSINSPNSYLYNFIIREKHLKEKINDSIFPFEEDFVVDNYGYTETVKIQNGNEVIESELVNISTLSRDYLDEFDYPEIVGSSLCIDVDEVLSNTEEFYTEFYDILTDDSFPLKKEYNSIIQYYEKLKEEISDKKESIHDLI